MQRRLESFREALASHPYVARLERTKPGNEKWLALRRTLAVGACLAAAAGLCVVLLTGNTPTWAEVTERFAQAAFLNVTIHIREDALATPEQIELWIGSGRRVRMRTGTQVVFARDGAVTKAFDVRTGTEAQPSQRTEAILASWAGADAFSLDALIRWAAGPLTETTPVVNANAEVSEDLVVFESTEEKLEWLRVWALRESRLPARLRVWDPRDGECLDAVFSYSQQQPAKFFDPDAYGEFLSKHWRPDATTGVDNGLVYAFLKDAGGKRLTMWPGDNGGAHNVVTRTIDGAAWSLADHSGKAVLLAFWEPEGSAGEWLGWLKEMYEAYGERDDFVLADVALGGDLETIQALRAENGVTWTCLHEPGRGFDNTLAKSLGVAHLPSMWLVHKEGSIEQLHHAGHQVEGAVLGLTYDAAHHLSHVLSQRYHKGGITQEEVKLLLGEPDSEVETDTGKEYRYRRLNAERSEAVNVSVLFDDAGRCIGFSTAQDIINPAVVTVTVSDAFWREHVPALYQQAGVPEDEPGYEVRLTARSGNRGTFFYGQDGQEALEPGKPYVRGVVPGTYDFYLALYEKNEFQTEHEILVQENVTLEKDQRETLQFD